MFPRNHFFFHSSLNVAFLQFIYLLDSFNIQTHKISNPLLNPLSANPTKWLNTLKQFVGNLPTTCLSVFDHFVKLALKWLSGALYDANLFHSTLIYFALINAPPKLF